MPCVGDGAAVKVSPPLGVDRGEQRHLVAGRRGRVRATAAGLQLRAATPCPATRFWPVGGTGAASQAGNGHAQ